MIDLEVIKHIKSRDALLLFELLRTSGSLQHDTTYKSIVALLSIEKLTTARGEAWTTATVRARLRELADAGFVSVTQIPGGARVMIFNTPRGAENDTPSQNEHPLDNCNKQPQTPVFTGSGGGADFHQGDQNHRAVNNIYYYNNKINKTNKQTKKSRQLFFDFSTKDEKPFTDTLASGRKHPEFASIRAWLVKQLWEPGLRSELIDRIAAAIIADLPGLSRHNVQAIINAAGDAVRYYENTNGLRGRKNKRDTVAPYLRQCLAAAGFAWTPTAPDLEPQPQPETRRIVLSPVQSVVRNFQAVPESKKPALNATRRKIVSTLGDRVKTLDYQNLTLAIRGILRCSDNTARVEALAIRQFIRQGGKTGHSHLVSVETP